MSGGVIASIFSGLLIDTFGVEIVTCMMLVFGQLQMVTLLFFDQYHSFMVGSFYFYTLFRSFLYPVFIASLTSRLGFKYFGILLGLGFALSGLWQLLMAPLNDAVSGDCHSKEYQRSGNGYGDDDDCFPGLWESVHLIQLSVLLGLMVIPFMDYKARLVREDAVDDYIRHRKPTSGGYTIVGNDDSGLGLSIDYGSIGSGSV
jgi:hypothetical protein